MRRILLSCAILGVLSLPAAAASARASAASKPGFLVVRGGAGNGGVTGAPVVTLVVQGFVLGSVKPQDQARVDVYQLPSKANQGGPTAVGGNVSSKTVRWHHRFTRHEFRGTGFRFRAMGRSRVVVRGSGVYLFAGGTGTVSLHGSSFDPGEYAIDGAPFRPLPKRIVTHRLGRG